ncbi:MAG: transposase [Rhodospirillum sp.]|nr:transposase [Rhodospirillum sp.]MCF8489425.1 transposase [Rhodospirillum sp.]MCF8502784.1 transposase [Rhodospirillum sp.]
MRGDSGFVRGNLMRWCEANGVDYILGPPRYILGPPRNTVLVHKARKIHSRAALEVLETNATTQVFGHFTHKTRSKSWNRSRHVIAKVLHKEGQERRMRFLVTSLDGNAPHVTEAMRDARKSFEGTDQAEPRDLMPRVLYEAFYCPRGDMVPWKENGACLLDESFSFRLNSRFVGTHARMAEMREF